ncbi:uncharacterized protein LOC119608200 [Lucilia sericata]|uniref:uncharacterized protein LOC119608200 n=1 Tax=Lucilia sericata TaxID=13632 RepID=UPI0018A80A91|nr:uncharacterized protein LOC119608200 [Lucilia sericata]
MIELSKRFVATIVILLQLLPSTWLYCYQLKMSSFRTTETPNYRFVMTLHNNQTLSSITRVIKEVPIPMWNLILVQHNNDARRGSKVEAKKILYNATYKVCEFWRYVKRIRVFNNVAQLLFNKKGMGNMSLKCPLAVGTYVMQNIHVPPDTGILKFMYWPNTIYSLFGNVYSQMPDKRMVLMCTYEINATVIKSC